MSSGDDIVRNILRGTAQPCVKGQSVFRSVEQLITRRRAVLIRKSKDGKATKRTNALPHSCDWLI